MLNDDLVRKFMKEAEAHGVLEFNKYPHHTPSIKMFNICRMLIEEEVKETLDAMEDAMANYSIENVTELLDGICDSIYVLCYTAHLLNLPLAPAFEEVCENNLTKVIPTCTVNEAGKIQKPEGYKKINIWMFIAECFADSRERFDAKFPLRSPDPNTVEGGEELKEVKSVEEMLKKKVKKEG